MINRLKVPKGGQWGTARINEFRYERYIRGGLLNIDNVVVVVILVGTISLKKDLRPWKGRTPRWKNILNNISRCSKIGIRKKKIMNKCNGWTFESYLFIYIKFNV